MGKQPSASGSLSKAHFSPPSSQEQGQQHTHIGCEYECHNSSATPSDVLLQVNGVLHVHLADGPTAHYKITNVVLGKDIKVTIIRGWLHRFCRLAYRM